MGLDTLLSNANPIASAVKGGVEGLLGGVGKAARDIRAAITGEEVLSSEARAAILQQTVEIEKAILAADVEVVKGQIEVNKIEAAQGPFRGGWRPAVGWVCVAGLAYTFLLRPLLPWVTAVAGQPNVPAMPALDMGDLMTILLGVLGLGGFRTYERIKGKV